MITNILAKNFMGQTFNQRLARKNLFIGPMGSGKSSRAMALELAREGSVRGMKANQDLFRSFGPAIDSGTTIFYVGFILDDKKRIERKYQRNRSGSVSEKFQVNGSHNVGKDIFFEALAGAPKIFNVSNFMALSDKKMIDFMFKRFPPSDPKVLKLDETIAKKETELNAKHEAIRAAETVVQRLSASKNEANIPGGTLAEIQSKIKSAKNEIAEVQANIRKIEIEGAEKSAREKTEAEQKVRQAAAAETNHGPMGMTDGKGNSIDPLEAERRAAEQRLKDRAIKSGRIVTSSYDMAMAAIDRIINTMAMAGCDVCAAFLIAKTELQKMEKANKNG